MAVLRLWSKSTNVSAGQTSERSSSRVTVSSARRSRIASTWKWLALEFHLDAALAQFELAQVGLERAEADVVGGVRGHFQLVSHKAKCPE